MGDVSTYVQANPIEDTDLLYLGRPTGATTDESNLKTTFSLLQAAMSTALIPGGHVPVGYNIATSDLRAHLAGIDAALQAVGGAVSPDDLVLSYIPTNYSLPGGNNTLGGGHLPGIDNKIGALVGSDNALDGRITALENAVEDAGDVTYTPSVLTDWNGDADPGNVDGALDQLSSRVETLESGGAGGPGSVVFHRWRQVGGGDVVVDPASLGVTITHVRSAPNNDTTVVLPAGRWLLEYRAEDGNPETSPAPSVAGATSGFMDKGAGNYVYGKAYKDGAGNVVFSFEENTAASNIVITIQVTKLP